MAKVRETAEEKRERITQVPVARPPREDEEEAAQKMFDAYLGWRRSRAVECPQWDDALAKIAYEAACKCGQAGELAHRVSMTDEEMAHISDVGMYAPWKPSGMENIQMWAESKGHRQMMQCDNGVSRAAFGVYENEDGIWYTVLAYEFDKSNQTNDENIHRLLAEKSK